LLKKKGGKSHFKRVLRQPVSAAVIVLSDTVAAGRNLIRLENLLLKL
jgi:hypothetical protein